MGLVKRLGRSHLVQRITGIAAAEYLRLVWLTSRHLLEPADIYAQMHPQLPVIIAMWHGQHFLVPFIRRGYPAKVLVSRHRDGEMNAIAAEWLGVGTIRGSGDASGRFDLKGGVGAFQTMLTTLQDGCSVALTADVPKIARVAGTGIIKLAQLSGRPILPAAITTSRRRVLRNWDRTTVNLPFSRLAMVAGETVTVPADADGARLEACRVALETSLNRATARAHELADHRVSDHRRGDGTVG
ncbi:MAG TPA: lysophospholipid acyltransferase family protein [Xanthobacteraceae bacterium]|nr:lysophospholipid acyltransferase family protein [Xanthobacteraceae bacterium]